MTYTTIAGDMWDLIAFKTLGSDKYVEPLINCNRQYIRTYIFKAGVKLTVPTLERSSAIKLPPWMR